MPTPKTTNKCRKRRRKKKRLLDLSQQQLQSSTLNMLTLRQLAQIRWPLRRISQQVSHLEHLLRKATTMTRMSTNYSEVAVILS